MPIIAGTFMKTTTYDRQSIVPMVVAETTVRPTRFAVLSGEYLSRDMTKPTK